MDEIMGYLGLARKAGFAEYGEDTVSGAMLAGKAKLLITADDASENTVKKVSRFAKDTSVVHITVPYSKKDLGTAIGKAECAVLALTDIGMAYGFTGKIYEKTGEYKEEAEALKQKLERAMQRKKEARSHELKVKKGRSGRKKE